MDRPQEKDFTAKGAKLAKKSWTGSILSPMTGWIQ
jgi:hypothetical protein